MKAITIIILLWSALLPFAQLSCASFHKEGMGELQGSYSKVVLGLANSYPQEKILLEKMQTLKDSPLYKAVHARMEESFLKTDKSLSFPFLEPHNKDQREKLVTQGLAEIQRLETNIKLIKSCIAEIEKEKSGSK